MANLSVKAGCPSFELSLLEGWKSTEPLVTHPNLSHPHPKRAPRLSKLAFINSRKEASDAFVQHLPYHDGNPRRAFAPGHLRKVHASPTHDNQSPVHRRPAAVCVAAARRVRTGVAQQPSSS